MWNLHKTEESYGERWFPKHIKFSKSFSKKPKILLSITGLSISNKSNIRITVEPRDIDEHGFDIVVKTWGDTAVYSATINWIAY
ncbi:H-type lectin domain-containing protein [Candidatus Magnetomoraceae bacterium gMMP-15]